MLCLYLQCAYKTFKELTSKLMSMRQTVIALLDQKS